jgi:hypothetical protein
MPLRPEFEGIFERQLIYGGPKVGKSWLYRAIGLAYLDSGNENFIHVIDNDKTVMRMLARTPELRDVIKPYPVQAHDLDALPGVTERIFNDVDDGDGNDWIVVDMINRPWDAGPTWFQKKVYGETNSMDYWTQVKKEKDAGDKSKSFGGYESDEWKHIKPAYMGWEHQLTYNAPCHLMLISEEGEVVEQFDKSGKLAAMYSITNGRKPKGEKGLPHRVDSIIHVGRTLKRDGQTVKTRDLTMVGDREREQRWEAATGGTMTIELPGDDEQAFVDMYLCEIAGWVEG